MEYVARMRKMRTEYKFLFTKSEAKKQLSRRKRRWEDIMDLKEIDLVLFNYINQAESGIHWRSLVNSVLNFRIS
jgi:hypothetical protein